MSNQFVGEVRLVGFTFAPTGWALTTGQILPISQYTALFSLLGTMYGGDGKSNFGLPNLQGSVALGFGQGPGLSPYDQGQTGGLQSIGLQINETPVHNHTPMAAGLSADKSSPAGNAFAKTAGANNLYSTSTSPVSAMSPSVVASVGGSGKHNNMMPYLSLNWVIAMQGIYPPRS